VFVSGVQQKFTASRRRGVYELIRVITLQRLLRGLLIGSPL